MPSLYLWKLLNVKPVKKNFKPEAKIQYDFVNCLRSLSIEGKLNCVWFAVCNETGRNDHVSYGVLLKNLGKISGTPDLIFMWEDGCAGIELKSCTGKQSQNQKLFESWCKDNKVIYKVARSDTEVFNYLTEWGVYEN